MIAAIASYQEIIKYYSEILVLRTTLLEDERKSSKETANATDRRSVAMCANMDCALATTYAQAEDTGFDFGLPRAFLDAGSAPSTLTPAGTGVSDGRPRFLEMLALPAWSDASGAVLRGRPRPLPEGTFTGVTPPSLRGLPRPRPDDALAGVTLSSGFLGGWLWGLEGPACAVLLAAAGSNEFLRGLPRPRPDDALAGVTLSSGFLGGWLWGLEGPACAVLLAAAGSNEFLRGLPRPRPDDALAGVTLSSGFLRGLPRPRPEGTFTGVALSSARDGVGFFLGRPRPFPEGDLTGVILSSGFLGGRPRGLEGPACAALVAAAGLAGVLFFAGGWCSGVCFGGRPRFLEGVGVKASAPNRAADVSSSSFLGTTVALEAAGAASSGGASPVPLLLLLLVGAGDLALDAFVRGDLRASSAPWWRDGHSFAMDRAGVIRSGCSGK
eukprot:CAMPEP_0114327416 /NCGR_PEP_ID=MMETSP0059-20121206/30286_1 /TAXON_ID=36894 /ORGANISM="Pyramimonas parkeae, Strain CCMP726" /LENGTH=439 /DNA_ID=CAMNT_0001456535 /DNA_START=9 /DNA_END=1330 /DNA_ORIENTATION=-